MATRNGQMGRGIPQVGRWLLTVGRGPLPRPRPTANGERPTDRMPVLLLQTGRDHMFARASVAALALLLIGIATSFAAPAPKPLPDLGATILCYHIVESPQDPRMEVSREVFRQQMRYLDMTGYTVISLRDLYEFASGKRGELPKNAVVITIDDGWRSTFTEVYPE